MARRRSGTPGPGEYWLCPARIAAIAASAMEAGPSVSGNPWPRFTEPVAAASADISAKIVVPRLRRRGTNTGRSMGRPYRRDLDRTGRMAPCASSCSAVPSFLGRAVVDAALARGWEVTTFNRGITGPDSGGVEAIRGDRSDEGDLDQLDGRTWDSVVDTSGYVPAVVGLAARRLADATAHYGFVSSISVYRGWPSRPIGPDEVWDCPPDAGPGVEYGEGKAGAERAVHNALPDKALQVRAGLILGPHENVGRLTWWLRRIAAGGRVLAPGRPDRAMQLIDARDLAGWMLDCAERGIIGTFDATEPAGNTTMGGWLDDCLAATGSSATLEWVDDEFLLGQGVEPWSELPLWTPADADWAHAWDVDTSAAAAAGLVCRASSQTVHDTWAWLTGGGTPVFRDGIGMDRAKEASLLQAWDAR